jgi:peptidoglycan/xylan/chitin deacetylase (PgdA/CDA1 family)
MLIAVVYHYIRPSFDDPHPSIYGVTPAQLEAQLRLLGGVGEFVEPRELRAAVQDGGRLPTKGILVTLDDGLREQFEWALPVLDRLGVTPLFFVSTQPIAQRAVCTVHKIHLLRARTAPAEFLALLRTHAGRQGTDVRLPEDQDAQACAVYRYDAPEAARLKYLLNFRLPSKTSEALVDACFSDVFGDDEAAISADLYMDREQIREIGARGCLGTHGHRHLPLGVLSPAAVWEDVETSFEYLTTWSGARPFALAYPYGTYEACSAQVGEIAAALGVELGFTGEAAGNADLRRPFHLARFDCNDLPGGRRARWDVQSLFARVPTARWPAVSRDEEPSRQGEGLMRELTR